MNFTVGWNEKKKTKLQSHLSHDQCQSSLNWDDSGKEKGEKLSLTRR